MKLLHISILFMALTHSVIADVEIDKSKDAYYIVYSSCANCCQSGEGIHLYVSNVIHTNGHDFSNLQGAFFDQVRIEYPDGAPNGDLSNGFTTEREAINYRRSIISDYVSDDTQIHELNL